MTDRREFFRKLLLGAVAGPQMLEALAEAEIVTPVVISPWANGEVGIGALASAQATKNGAWLDILEHNMKLHMAQFHTAQFKRDRDLMMAFPLPEEMTGTSFVVVTPYGIET